jgi:hypothetical protein
MGPKKLPIANSEWSYWRPDELQFVCIKLERVMGIEPTPSAWKAEVLPLNYTRRMPSTSIPTLPLVEGGGFEPPKAEPADLQSAPFGRSGTPPSILFVLHSEASVALDTAGRHPPPDEADCNHLAAIGPAKIKPVIVGHHPNSVNTIIGIQEQVTRAQLLASSRRYITRQGRSVLDREAAQLSVDRFLG